MDDDEEGQIPSGQMARKVTLRENRRRLFLWQEITLMRPWITYYNSKWIMAANALFNFPASLRLSTPLPSLPLLLCVCIYWLFAQNYEIISTWVQLPQAHTHTQAATYCNALQTHTHKQRDRHTQPCGWIACCTSIFEFCCFIISCRNACNLSLPLSVSLYDWFLGFYVLGIGIIIIISRLAALGNL